MKLGLDYHGVLDKNPELFVNMALSFEEVHIITGHKNTKEFREKLGKLFHLNPWWDYIYSLTDELEKEGCEVIYMEKNRKCYNQNDWNRAKAVYCKKHKIDLHIDNNSTYGRYFKTPFMLYLHK